MSECVNCNSDRLANIYSSCRDPDFTVGEDIVHYIPDSSGIGGDVFIEFTYCLDCGQIQGIFPVPDNDILLERADIDVLNEEE